MIKHIWSLLCRRSTIDKESNNLSIFDIFEQLEVNVTLNQELEKINIPIEYEVVNFFQKNNDVSEEKLSLKIEVYDPDNKKLKTFENLITIPQKLWRMRMQNRIKGIELNKSGIYIYKIFTKQEKDKDYIFQAEIPLQVKINKQINKESKNKPN